ncbi:TrmB family transcriptional regulator [Anaerocolumna xylanovorans]|uniref:Sugar-specific transcriptional regulator TrmB n=1 Tax=Anaerocolumna xylanovorans DSM 12503 TaxID=1121345 RepID=A0A1M7Y848_9FIRM|nr:TrmB family transcriptional regulator [Anaerocolumna xylanovorans]SHO48726.1 Sugar-specific transcriptional regulator TrmB [Anaerocolumna xylanovorans DSM 12503]
MELIDQFMSFGLTRQESNIYLTLQVNGELTGYEVAKLTGISRSNTYNALAGLVDKGAAYVMEGNVTKYTAVAFEEFSSNAIHKLTTIRDRIISNLPERKKETGGYITIKGEEHIINKLRNLLSETESRIYISVSSDILDIIRPDVQRLIVEKKKVVVLTDSPKGLEGAIIYIKEQVNHQIRLIVDSCKVLTGEITDKDFSTCLYSRNQNLVDVFKEMLQNEITLLQLKEKEPDR